MVQLINIYHRLLFVIYSILLGDRMDDAQAWWRSAALRSQELAPDPLGINDKYQIRQPLNWRYDNYVYT